jgi:hypothetical protein
MRRREVWAIAIAQYTSAWGFYGLLAWLPSFFLEHCGVALNSLGGYTLAPYLVMAVVGGSAGMLADNLVAKGWGVRDVRVTMQVRFENFGAGPVILPWVSQPCSDNGVSRR